jgi:hypothetical protein
VDNKILNEIKSDAVKKLMSAYGFCGLAEGPEVTILNSNDMEGKDIKITIELER